MRSASTHRPVSLLMAIDVSGIVCQQVFYVDAQISLEFACSTPAFSDGLPSVH